MRCCSIVHSNNVYGIRKKGSIQCRLALESIVWKRLARQSSFKDIAKSLGISPSTAHRIYCEFIERGDVGPVKSKGPKRKLDDYV